MASEATHEDAKLLLQLYDLRRERRLRRARDFVQRECKFKNYKDYVKRYPEGSKEAGYVGMVIGYWDMACTLAARGLINQELFNALNHEHVSVWNKFKPLVQEWRKQYNAPDLMRSMETLAGRHPSAVIQEAGKNGGKRGKQKAREEDGEDEE